LFFIKKQLIFLLMILSVFYTVALYAAEPLRVGILAYRPKAQTVQQWQPITQYLALKLNRPVVLSAYGYGELNRAIEDHQVDVVLTNPGHYIQLRYLHGLSAPLATMMNKDGQWQLDRFGGVIFTRADNTDINKLTDLKNKRIAVIDGESLGGYQMQAYMLKQANIRLDETQLLSTGIPHDRTVSAVLSKQADVGFLRTGVLEGMVNEGKLALSQIKIINEQSNKHFPFLLSTKLYPEWPVAVMSDVDANTTKALAVALLSLPIDGAEVRAAGIYSFITPANYSEVEDLLRGLHLSPFDKVSLISLNDLWSQYRDWILVISTFSFLIIMLAWNIQSRRVIHVQRALLDNEARFKHFFDANNSVMLLIDPETGKILDANYSAKEFYGYTEDALKELTIYQINQLSDEQTKHEMHLALAEKSSHFNFTHRLANDSLRDVEVYSSPTLVQGKSILFAIIHDITERKKLENQQKLAASVFKHAREGIIITDENADIIDVNHTFYQITGYSRDEVLGKNTRLLHSGRQSAEFYAQMWLSLQKNDYWCGEIWNKRKTGDIYAEMLTISLIRDEAGQAQNYIALFSDITSNKHNEQELKRIAHYDTLTGLPNRLLLAEHLQQKIDHSLRHNQFLAIVYIDLDGFKAINDTHGHHIGDELLIIVANRMKSVSRDTDMLARIGGDEFVALFGQLNFVDDYQLLINRLLSSASQPINVNGLLLHVSASIGVTIYPKDNSDAELLMRHADQAMYKAKQLGKNRFCLWDGE
jgi:diguanylate cyclase (GGDEF)-like protein/PAS domain S-box-containing protein